MLTALRHPKLASEMPSDRQEHCLFVLGTAQEISFGHHIHRITLGHFRSHFTLDCANLALAIELVQRLHREELIATCSTNTLIRLLFIEL